MIRLRNILPGFLLALAIPGFCQTQSAEAGKDDFTDLGLEDLMKIEVFDAFKTPHPLIQTPAAVYVVTSDQIKRSGATTIPEILRLVPGVEVQREGSVYYSVSLRGFAGAVGNKLLVLLDGRSLYSQYQNATYWEIENIVVDDIDRVEVVEGPGGSIWGANATNGVINIVTKNASKTLGGFAVQDVGDLLRNESTIQYGDKIGALGAFRAYASYGTMHAADLTDAGGNAHDGSNLDTAGFRMDLDFQRQGTLMLQGAIGQYAIAENQTVPTLAAPYTTTAQNTDHITTSDLVAKWDLTSPDGAHTTAQAYYDLISYPYTDEGSTALSYDLSAEHRFADSHGQSVTIGAGYRYMLNGTFDGPTAIVVPESRRDTVYNAFAQDEISFAKTQRLLFGLRLEHNNYTGFEVEPNIRYAFMPDDKQTLWASVGRNVRTPSQVEENGYSLNSVSAPGSGQELPVATATLGNAALKPEELIANEIGYRKKLSDRISFDVSGYYNIYDDLIVQLPGAPFVSDAFGEPITVDPSYYVNAEHGQTYGGQLSGKICLSKDLRADLAFTTIHHTPFGDGLHLSVPHYDASTHLAWDPMQRLQLDGTLHWYDATFSQHVPAYIKCDLHIGWDLTSRLSLGLGGYDLFEPRHIEFGESSAIPRSFIADLKFRF